MTWLASPISPAEIATPKRRKVITCSIDGCDKPLEGRSWCKIHYQRWRNHGDPNVCLRRPNRIARRFIEDAVKYSGEACLIWPFSKSRYGYAIFTADGTTKVVSRMVCEAVNGPPPTPKHEAAHSCGKGRSGCINPGHLSWKTSVENAADKEIHGTVARGERNGSAKLTAADVKAIRALAGVVPRKELAARFKTPVTNICNIQNRKAWRHV